MYIHIVAIPCQITTKLVDLDVHVHTHVYMYRLNYGFKRYTGNIPEVLIATARGRRGGGDKH